MSELDQFYNNASLSTDFYELTMAAAYFSANQCDKLATFEMFVKNSSKEEKLFSSIRIGTGYRISFKLQI